MPSTSASSQPMGYCSSPQPALERAHTRSTVEAYDTATWSDARALP
jgi:hypothetical protein